MKTGIIGIINNPATSINSHSAGWNDLVRRSIDETAVFLTEHDNWDEYDRLIINHGPNFKPGQFNVIGGITDSVLDRVRKLNEFKGSVVSVDGFKLDEFVAKRKLNIEVKVHISEGLSIKEKKFLLIGDSHAISVWPGPDWNISRRDGKTLYGFLKNPEPANWFYFGNIDVRFHLPRQEKPEQATIELANRYLSFAATHDAGVTCLLPVESESRKLPSTGLHKGEKFFGSRSLRAELVRIFNECLLIQDDVEVISWPKKWYADIEYYEKEVMEPRQSVHIRPKYYYYASK